MKTAELRDAFEWTCDNCGADQFERAIAAELTDEDAEQMGLDPDCVGHLIAAPDQVTCRNCGQQFTTTHPGDAQ